MAQAFTVPEHPGSSSTSRDDVNELRRVPLAALKVDETVQQRVGGTAKKVVAEYAEAMRNGAKFPPATVFSSDGLTFILADGFHRIAAHRLAHPDTPEIECETLAGDRDDALIFACGANALHGLRRTYADKRKSVVTLLHCDKWSRLSDREIARQCNVSHPFVAKVRKQMETFPKAGQSANNPSNPSYSGQDATEVGHVLRRHRARTSKRSSYSKRTRSGQKTPVPFLASHAWWLADDGERLKFLQEVGVRELFKKLFAADPRFDFLEVAWQMSNEEERSAFAKKRLNPIGAIAAESDTPADAGSSMSGSRLEPQPAGAMGRILLGAPDDDMVIENLNLGSLSTAFDDVGRGYIQTEVEKLPQHAQVFLSALAFEKDDREEEALGSVCVEGIVNLILEDLNHRASCRNLDLIGPHRNDVIGYDIEGSGMVWSALSERDEALDLIASHADAIIDPDGDLSELAEEMVDAFMGAAKEEADGVFFEFLERFGSNVRSLLHENDVLPCLRGIRADLLDRLGA